MANTLKLPVGIENFEEIRKLVSIILTRQGLLSSSYRDEDRCDILAYGIAFCRKRCRVVGEKF